MNVMKARAASPDVLVDLNRLEELRRIARSDDGGLELGAMATYTQLMLDPAVAEARPVVAEVAATIGDVQVRNRGTIGGNVCSNDPTNHFPPLMVALGARMTIRGGDGEREVPAEDFFLGVYLTAVAPGELLTRVTLPPGRRDGFAAVTLGRDGTCIVSAAASLDGEAAGRDRLRRRRPGARPTAGDGRGERARSGARGRARPAVGRPRLGRLPPAPRRGARRPRRPASPEPLRRLHGARQQRPSQRGGERRAPRGRGRGPATARPLPPRRPRPHRHPHRVRHRQLRRLLGDRGRAAAEELHDPGRAGRRRLDRDRRGARAGGRADDAAAGLQRAPRAPVRLLHARDADERDGAAPRQPRADRGRGAEGAAGEHLPLHRLLEHRRGGARRVAGEDGERRWRREHDRPRGAGGPGSAEGVHGRLDAAQGGQAPRPGAGRVRRRREAARHGLRLVRPLALRTRADPLDRRLEGARGARRVRDADRRRGRDPHRPVLPDLARRPART